VPSFVAAVVAASEPTSDQYRPDLVAADVAQLVAVAVIADDCS